MLEVDWTAEGGWGAPQISKYKDLSLSPAASSLHYSLQCFEGMKAYRSETGEVRLFRPDMNAARLLRSSTRLALPAFDQDELIAVLKKLVEVDKDWIPQQKGYSLYIRPTVISTDVCLGVAPPAAAKLFVITCPVGPYYKDGFKPVSLIADSSNVRAWKGGTGDYKVGGNYGPTIAPQVEAAKKGYQQILWLGENNIVTEVGAMNIFFLFEENGQKELVTCPLDGTVLPGVTRNSILQLAREMPDLKVSERLFTMDEVAEKSKNGQIIESFGSGTAAIVSPVNRIGWNDVDYEIPVPEESMAMSLMQKILSIQSGELEYHDPKWSVKVC